MLHPEQPRPLPFGVVSDSTSAVWVGCESVLRDPFTGPAEDGDEGLRKVSKASSYSLQTLIRRSWTSLTAFRSSRGVEVEVEDAIAP